MSDIQPEVQEEVSGAKWYVAHTYSGYEMKVKANIEKTIENRNLQNQILEVSVPLQEVVEMKNGTRKAVQHKLFPGYVLIHMVMNDDTWYVVRNTRGVTGFVGPGSKAVALTEEEMRNLGINRKAAVEFQIGETVIAVSGAWENTVGQIKAINEGKRTVTIFADVFGRETPVDLSFDDIRRM